MSRSTESTSRVRIKDLKLNILLETTKAINNNASTEDLLENFEAFLRDNLKIEKLLLYSYDSEWNCVLQYGVLPAELERIDPKRDLSGFSEITFTMALEQPHLKPFDVIIPVTHKSEPLAFLLIGDLYDDEIAVSPTIRHLPFIQTLTNIIAVAIENKRLAKERVRQEVMRKELELASQMQNFLFPRTLPQNDRIEISALYQPHQQVGGDYYDYIKINENEFAICMADVSGKGVSAALLMANFQAHIRALFSYTTSMRDLVRELNNKVMNNAQGEKFITLFVARYNIVTRKLHYVNAGHNPPILATGNSVMHLNTGCMGLGMFDELPTIREGIVPLGPHSTLVCYTDGLVETENAKEEEFGMSRLSAILEKNYYVSMEELNRLIMEELEEFKNGAEFLDDVTLLSMRVF